MNRSVGNAGRLRPRRPRHNRPRRCKHPCRAVGYSVHLNHQPALTMRDHHQWKAIQLFRRLRPETHLASKSHARRHLRPTSRPASTRMQPKRCQSCPAHQVRATRSQASRLARRCREAIRGAASMGHRCSRSSRATTPAPATLLGRRTCQARSTARPLLGLHRRRSGTTTCH